MGKDFQKKRPKKAFAKIHRHIGTSRNCLSASQLTCIPTNIHRSIASLIPTPCSGASMLTLECYCCDVITSVVHAVASSVSDASTSTWNAAGPSNRGSLSYGTKNQCKSIMCSIRLVHALLIGGGGNKIGSGQTRIVAIIKNVNN